MIIPRLHRNSRSLLIVFFLLVMAQVCPCPAAADEGGSEADRPKIGLALSGGGAKGCAHVGVLKVLEEMNVPVDYIAGTSMGAIVGGLYASGLSADELADIMVTTDWDDLMRDKPPRKDMSFRRKSDELRYLLNLELGVSRFKLKWPSGLKSGQKLFYLLRSLTLPVSGIRDFDDLPIPFRAVATDIAAGEMVVLKEGDLAAALRASMSIPTVFSTVELDGRTLVDGGLVNNVPVDLVQEMGADIVIAVDISAPLEGRDVQSFLQVLQQTNRMLTRMNMNERLEDADLVLKPDVSHFGMLQFDVAAEIIELGAIEARSNTKELAALAVQGETERRHHRARQVARATVPEVAFVRWEGNRRVDDRIIVSYIKLKAGDELDLEALGRDLSELYGLGDFEKIEFTIVEESGDLGVVIQLHEKPWGPNYLHFGLFFASDLDVETQFQALINLTFTRLNSRGAEWRNDLKIGNDRKIFSEFYQPLDYSGGWFVAPSIEFGQNRSSLYSDGRKTADLDVRFADFRLGVGRQFSKFGEARVGVSRGRGSAKAKSGSLPEELIEQNFSDIDFGTVFFEGTIDRLDSASIPLHGAIATGRASFSQRWVGAQEDYAKIEFSGFGVKTFGRHSILGSLGMGLSPGGDLPVYDEFSLGGFLSFSGFNEDELRGQYLGVVRAGYYYRLTGKIYTGGWLETGNVWESSSEAGFDELIFAATGLFGLDSYFGPIYLAYGWADEGSSKIYISLGRNF